jgi:hypothetical protein
VKSISLLLTRGLAVAFCSAVLVSAAGASASAARTLWYVDPGAKGSNTGRSWANAWASFASIRWRSVQPGDIVYLSGGRTYTSTLTVFARGTSGRPVTIAASSAAGHNGMVVFDYRGFGSSAEATGITLDGNHLTLSGKVGRANHLRIDNLVNTSSGTSSAGVSCAGHTGIRILHVTFTNDNNPISCTSTSGITISHNRFVRVRGDAAIAMAGSRGGLDSSIVSGNYIETVSQRRNGNGPDGVQNGSGVTIANNHFKQVRLDIATSDQHPDMIQNQGDNTRVRGNTFVNVGDSAFDFDTFADRAPHDIYIYDNVFRIVDPIDPYPDFIRFYHSSGGEPRSIRNFVVANNVFADANGGSGIPPVNICYYDPCGSPATSGNRVTNNIFVNVGSGGPNGPMLYLSRDAGSGWTADHNVYYRSSRGYVYWKGSRYTAGSFAASVDRFGSTGLPRFVRYDPRRKSDDFHLRAGDRVARNRGATLGSMFRRDKDGVPRPQGHAWDVGAYEWHRARRARG